MQPLATEGKSQIFDKFFLNKSVHFWQQSWQHRGKDASGKGGSQKRSHRRLEHTTRIYVIVRKQINYCILWRTQTGESRWTHGRSPKNLSQYSLTSQRHSLQSHPPVCLRSRLSLMHTDAEAEQLIDSQTIDGPRKSWGDIINNVTGCWHSSPSPKSLPKRN